MPTPLTPSSASPEAGWTGFFVTLDGLRLHVQEWTPSEPPRSVVLIVHGLAEHGARYADLATHLVAHGHAVHVYDQRGHGRSEGRRAFVDAFDQYIDDLAVYHRHVRAAYPDLPLFLFAHSMGGAIATLFVLDRTPDIAGLILSSAMLKIQDDIAPLLQKVSQLLGRLFPRLPTVTLDRDALCRDPDVVARVEADPLYFRGRIPARTGAEMLRATERIKARREELDVPLLLLHGTADRLTAPSGSTTLYQQARSQDKTLALYPGLYHETFNEPEKEEVLREITDWLDEHL